MSELLPCPFCGGEARWLNHYGRMTQVICPTCMASSLIRKDADEVRAAWNTRPPQPDLSKVREALTAEIARLNADRPLPREGADHRDGQIEGLRFALSILAAHGEGK